MTTGAQIRSALAAVGGIGGQKWSFDELARGADDAMAQAGITTREGAAVFISQCMVESAYWRTSVEYGSGRLRYDPYRGRGFIQCTFESNYRGFGRWCQKRGLISDSEYFVKNPARLGDYKWAWLTATWYLSTHRHDLIKLANEGQIDSVGKGVHAGDAYASWYPNAPFHRNRMDHTRKAYNALLKAGVKAPGGSASAAGSFTASDVKNLQRVVGVAADGKWGPGTDRNAQAIRAFVRGGLTPTDAQRKIYADVNNARKGGRLTTAEVRKEIQKAVKVTADGIWGRNTDAAFEAMRDQHKMASVKAKLPAPKSAAKKPAKINPRLSVDGKLGPATYKALQRHVGVTADGKFGPATKRAMQRWLKVTADGIVGRNTVKALQRKVGATPDGIWGSGTTKALQRYLNKNG